LHQRRKAPSGSKSKQKTRAVLTLDQPSPLRPTPPRPPGVIRARRLPTPQDLVVLFLLPERVPADLGVVIVRDGREQEIRVDRRLDRREERVEKMRSRSGPIYPCAWTSHVRVSQEVLLLTVGGPFAPHTRPSTHQDVKPFKSRISGCSQRSVASEGCCVATKLCRKGLFAGVSTGRPCATRRAVELEGQSESQGEKPVGSATSYKAAGGSTAGFVFRVGGERRMSERTRQR
jgi:hypothetical protein